MRVSQSLREGVSVLLLEGEFDSFEAAALTERLGTLLSAEKPRLVFDLNAASFLDSSTFAAFLAAQRHAQSRGGIIVLARPRHGVLKTMKTLGIDHVFPVFGSTEDAVASLRGS